MADPSEVGKYGTIRLLKRRELTGVVAAYPIDDEQVSFGRDALCSVRLYYPEVSPMHCRIVFEERKAFLQVFGVNGVIVDGCPVYPTKPAAFGDPPTTVTVPLPNGSVFEIHKKRFMFNYPPKALRPQLFTPATVRRKSVRMSLVQSAQVFSPAPSPHPRENLRVLQSPLRLTSSESPVRLVDGDHPRVYEEEQDLIILEEVEPQSISQHPGIDMPPSPMRLQTLPPSQQGPPTTPRRRSAPSLHRAVLIRSAQRIAYMRESQAQLQRQQADCGPQFEEISLDEEDAEGEEISEQEEEEEVINSILNTSGEVDGDMTGGDESQEDMSLDEPAMIGENAQIAEQDITEANSEYREEEEEENPFTTPLQVGQALHLGTSMTPQPGLFAKRHHEDQNERRKVGPQRPPPGFRFSLGPALGGDSVAIKEEVKEEQHAEALATSPTKRAEITEEERRAILERRRSALKAPDPEIGGSVTGLGDHRGSAQLPQLAPSSPFKTLSSHIEEGEDTQVVLQRMQAQVAERRASLSPTRPRISRDIGRGMLPPSPQKLFSLLATDAEEGVRGRGVIKLEDGIMEETQNQLAEYESMDIDDTTGAEKHQVEGNTDQNDENEGPTRSWSQTPRLDGVRELFRAPSEAAGLATPAIRGIRNLFRAPAVQQTPRMDGVRQLFAEQQVPQTPAFDGIGEMMHVDEQDEIAKGVKNALQDVPEDVEEGPEAIQAKPSAPIRKLPLATRTLSRSRVARPTLFRTRGTPTDMSTMADDEATPDSGPIDLPKRLDVKNSVPDGAVVHRTSRVRRAATTTTASDLEGSKAATSKQNASESYEGNAEKFTPRRGRQTKAKADQKDTDHEVEQPSPVKPPSKSKGRRKVDSTPAQTKSENHNARGSAQPEEASSSPVKRRSTRARSRSADPESDDNAETIAKPSQQVKAVIVETIPEEDEPASTQAQPPRKATTPPSRTCRTRTRTESSADDGPPKKRAGPSSSSTTARRVTKSSVVESTADENVRPEDKENTPDHSPVSESGEDTSAPAKPAPKGRAAAKGTVTSKAKGTLGTTGRAKPVARTAKIKTGDEVAPVTRATRTRSRK